MPYTTLADLNRAYCDEIFSKYHKTDRVSHDWPSALRHRKKLKAHITPKVARRLSKQNVSHKLPKILNRDWPSALK